MVLATVVDLHHHILLSESVRAAVRDTQGGTLLHFDSHDDMGCASLSKKAEKKLQEKGLTLQAALKQCILQKDASALEFVDIGTWIMPLVALGAYNRVIWVTKWANMRECSFTATAAFCDNTVLLTGSAVPNVWRVLWGHNYVTKFPSKCSTPQKVHITVVCAANAVRQLRKESIKHCTVTVDLDFFTTCNPTKKALFSGRDSIALQDLFDLSTFVPIEQGTAFYLALEEYMFKAGTSAHDVRACATGTSWEQGSRKSWQRDEGTVRAVLDVVKAGFNPKRKAADLMWVWRLCGCSHLAEHKSTEAEIQSLMDNLSAALDVIKKSIKDVIIATSSEYRWDGYYYKRQAIGIQKSVVDIVSAL